MIERIQLLEITKKKKYCHQIKLIPNTANGWSKNKSLSPRLGLNLQKEFLEIGLHVEIFTTLQHSCRPT